MVSDTARLDNRSLQDIRITPEEAIQMFELGFNFSIFGDGDRNDYRLSLPYRVIQNIDHDTITFVQG